MRRKKFTWFGLIFALSLSVRLGFAAEPDASTPGQKNRGDDGAVISRHEKLAEKMAEARTALWTRYFDPKTCQFFTTEPSRLPGAERVKRLDPNECGYGTGMDDCPLFGGILLAAICDQYEVTKDESLKADALTVYKGLKFCATAHGIPGFVARGVCLEDGKSIYITSSRDQYTHLVHGFWRYYHSPLCDEDAKQTIRKILQAVADRMTRNVTPENNYDFLRADGTQDPRGICRMWNVRAHEAARLPMFYAAAWDVGGNEEHYRLYRKYLPEGIEQSLELSRLPEKEVARWIPPYAVLQMQSSLELLYALERDPEMKPRVKEAVRQVSKFAAEKRVFTIRKRKPGVREYGETALAQLMFEEPGFTEQHQVELAGAILKANYPVHPGAAYCLLGAYWKARVRGFYQP